MRVGESRHLAFATLSAHSPLGDPNCNHRPHYLYVRLHFNHNFIPINTHFTAVFTLYLHLMPLTSDIKAVWIIIYIPK